MDSEFFVEESEDEELVNDINVNHEVSDDIDCEYIKHYPGCTEQKQIIDDVICKYEEHDGDLNIIMEAINIPYYEEVTAIINSSIPLIIDADALITFAFLQDNHDISMGGQYLHVVYFCERFLNILSEKGANFLIVLFDVWGKFWEKNPYLSCVRLAVYTHLEKHTRHRIFKFETFDSIAFKKFINDEKPRAILLDLSYHLKLDKLNERMSMKFDLVAELALLINCTEIIFFRSNDLHCIDICEINMYQSVILSYGLHSRVNLNALSEVLCARLKDIEKLDPSLPKPNITINGNLSNYDCRHVFVAITSNNFLLHINDTNILKIILLSYASLDVLHLESRCCPILKCDGNLLRNLQEITSTWLDSLRATIEVFQRQNIKLNWKNIADIWQGTMFHYICYIIKDTINSGNELGHFQQAYEHYLDSIERECNLKIEPYPIHPYSETAVFHLVEDKMNDNAEKVNLYILNNLLIKRFSGTIVCNNNWLDPPNLEENQIFYETRHWHSRLPLTDEYDRIIVAFTPGERIIKTHMRKQWAQKQIILNSNYLNVYGNNLEGNAVKYETIICQKEISKKKKTVDKKLVAEKKKEKTSRSSMKIKEKIQIEKQQKILSQEQEVVSQLRNNFEINGHTLSFGEKLDHLNSVLKRLTIEETITSIKLTKLHVYRDHIISLQPLERSVELVKEVYLVIRSILCGNKISIFDNDKTFLSEFLHELGLTELALRNNLPSINNYSRIMDLNWIRFQLEHLGPDLERSSENLFDRDIGFAPDPWQAKFIDAVRKRKSVFVVAPTSSGKTFAAYYCMKRVLQESEDGVVVYVAPTKALVNQVEATVYSRFKNVKLRNGKHVVGTFTRDCKKYTLTCRILITVPQCLDILLLSPRRFTWLKHLKYAIFDEVHRLSGNLEGLVWERCLLLIRCPFLALSATISDIHEFHTWLQNNENFKCEQDRILKQMRDSYEVVLVHHTERHSDLTMHFYSNETDLQPYHPYAALDAKTMREWNGVPSTIQLSPSETLQLYDVMYLNRSIRKKMKEQCNISDHFSNAAVTGFISRHQVTEFENKLAQTFYEIYIEDTKTFENIIKQLSPKKYPGKLSDMTEIPELLNRLHQKDLLPCIVFSFNRSLVESATHLIVEDCQKRENIVDRRTEKLHKKLIKTDKRARDNKENSSKGWTPFDNSTSSEILRFTGSKYKGDGLLDSNDLEFIEKRLAKVHSNNQFKETLPYGVTYHHGGLNSIQRSTVEMLFRLGVVKVVFATGTLAVGLHMPCKTVVIFGDSSYLNSIEYHQMSGRAGRRGFDNSGNVIFMGLTKKRCDNLITSKLPKMLGNFPVDISLIAKFLTLVSTVTDNSKSTENATNVSISRVISYLENSLIYQIRPNLKIQVQHYVNFAMQLLFIQGFCTADGVPLKLSGIINHLVERDPGNLVFAYLLRTGALRNLILSMDSDKDRQWSLVIVLSHLFCRLKLHPLKYSQKFDNSVVILEPLPPIILEAIRQYNTEVKNIFDEYFVSVAKDLAPTLGKDETLPLSGITYSPQYFYEDEQAGTLSARIKSTCSRKIACSSFVALSGNDDKNLFTGTIISNIRHEICPGIKVVPLLETDIVHNSYVADFYRHGILEAIRKDNGFRGGKDFDLLNDFLLILKSIVLFLEDLEPINKDDPLYTSMKKMSGIYHGRYSAAFY